MKPVISSIVALSTLAILTGCGGGGGGGSSSSSDGLPAVNAVEASPSAANGADATQTVLDMGDVSSLGLLAASDEKRVGFDALKFAALQQKILINSLDAQTPALNETVNNTTQCSGGGTISITGSQTETSMDYTLSADNCIEGSITLDGSIHVTTTGTNYGETLSSLHMGFTEDYTMGYGSSTVKIHQWSYIDLDYSSYTDDNTFAGTYTSSLWFELDAATPIEARYDDLTVAFSYSSSSIEHCYKAGRIYINNITEYLDIDETYDPNCDHPFVHDGSHLLSGSLEYSVSDGRHVHVEVTDTNEITITDDEGGSEVI
ncbi:MAG: hypothetical protein U9Q62_09685 [Campylobacterota bacterium]|nr:hypothetical protein [Campylobacterota bacterium]